MVVTPWRLHRPGQGGCCRMKIAWRSSFILAPATASVSSIISLRAANEKIEIERKRERKLKASGEFKPARGSRLPARQLAIGLQGEAEVVRAADRHRILDGGNLADDVEIVFLSFLIHRSTPGKGPD
jgi:hypothetical protein